MLQQLREMADGKRLQWNSLLEWGNTKISDSKHTFNITYYPVFQNVRSILEELQILLAPRTQKSFSWGSNSGTDNAGGSETFWLNFFILKIILTFLLSLLLHYNYYYYYYLSIHLFNLFVYLFIFLFIYLLIMYLFQWQEKIRHLIFHFLSTEFSSIITHHF